MPNEFEKQVQQMMDELKLVPSEPVWQKVEMQIRKKKDRRRMILWIPLLILLLGGGLWIGIDQYSNKVAYQKTNDESQTQRSITASPSVTNQTTKTVAQPKTIDNKIQTSKKKVDEKLIVRKSENIYDVVLKNKIQDKPNKKVEAKVSLMDQAVTQKHLPQRIELPNENSSVKEEKLPVKNEDTVLSKARTSEIVIHKQLFEKIDQMVSSLDIIQNTGRTSAFPFDKMPIKPTLSIPDSLKQDSTLTKNSGTKRIASAQWKLNLVAASGLSGLSRLDFLNVFDGQKSMDALYQSSPGSVTNPGVTYYGPSPIKKGLSFSIGGATQKQLSKRLVFSAGLQYNYYSNSILVGNKIRRDTVFRSSYSVSQYFTNNSATYSLLLENYHNHYHFISIPLTLDWQMFKKFPLNFHTGFSVQQMMQTNALTFDYNAQAYYHNNKAFNKTLVFTEYGFNYSIPFANHYLALGPQLQYGLTALEKNNSTHHLFSYGLKAQLQFNKK